MTESYGETPPNDNAAHTSRPEQADDFAKTPESRPADPPDVGPAPPPPKVDGIGTPDASAAAPADSGAQQVAQLHQRIQVLVNIQHTTSGAQTGKQLEELTGRLEELREAFADDEAVQAGLDDVENELNDALDEVRQASQNQQGRESKPAQKSDAGSGKPSGPRRDDRQKSSGPRPEPNGQTVVARYGLMHYVGEFRHSLKEPPRIGQKLVIRTDRGVELGEVIIPVDRQNPEPGPTCLTGGKLQQFLEGNGEEYPFRRSGRVLRAANNQDIVDFRHLEGSAREAGQYCRQQIKEFGLPMSLVTVEHLLGGERIVFYFTAEQRVDFRELVRHLASQFRTRIEMRQVGARDEARLVADYERCGQRCCCRQYLKDLKPVSMRMAKVQKATLDPAKISGRCGRLMCCLRYEDECYEQLRKNLPKKNSWVRTQTTIGRVLDSQILTQLVRLALPDGTVEAVPIDELTERNLSAPTQEELASAAADQVQARRKAAKAAAEALTYTPAPAEDQEQDQTPPKQQQDEADQPKKTKRRRRGKKRSGSGKSTSQGQTRDSSDARGQAGDQPKKKRRRRRRRKPGSGGQGLSGGSSQNSGGS